MEIVSAMNNPDTRGVMLLSRLTLAAFLSGEYTGYLMTHGLRDIQIDAVEYKSDEGVFVLYISSPDIPAYVMYHGLMDDITYYNNLPLMVVTLEALNVKKEG